MRSYQPFQQNMVIKPNKSIAMVIQRFKALDLQNKELLKLAENVQRSSFVVFNSPPPQIIRRLQQELRRNLSILIDSIRQVFIDMDKRLRALAQIIEQQPITQNSMRTQYSVFSSNKNEDTQRQRQGTFYGSIPNLVDPYSSLVQRISSLQINLKNTQQNQAKLISIIQKLQRRREQQPTITSELKYQQNSKLHKEFSDQLIQKSMIESSGFQTSFRLFSLQTQYQGQYQNQNQNKLKAREKESVTMAKQKKSSPKSFVCFGAPLSDSLDPSRISPQMPQINYEKNYASTHSHRLNFMINTLNS